MKFAGDNRAELGRGLKGGSCDNYAQKARKSLVSYWKQNKAPLYKFSAVFHLTTEANQQKNVVGSLK